jgi:radical SAM superfamily enzyme YgiQ (UPF0313 family)
MNKMINVAIVVPPSIQIPTPGREFLLRTPIEGVSYIATTIKNAGYPVQIIDCRGTNWSIQNVADKLKSSDVVAVATYVDSFPFTKELIILLKKNNASIPVIIGGPLVSSMPNVLMENLKADFAVIGEGEITVLELLGAIVDNNSERIKSIEGIAYRNADNTLTYTPRRKEMDNLDCLPNVDLLLWPSVREKNEIPEIGFTSSRGCHQNCHFCYKLYHRVRYQSPARFGVHISELVKKHDIKYAYINDLTFVAKRERAIEICNELAKTGIHWSCSTRVENMDLELLKTMRSAGCTDIWYGIESADQRVLDANNKKTTLEEIENAVKLTNQAGIKVMGNFIVGLLGETQESLDKMMKFIERKEVIPCSIKYLTPFPGSYIYDQALKKGLIKNEVDYLYHLARKKVNAEDDEIVNCTDLPDEVLRDAFRRIRKITLERSADVNKIRHSN